MALDYKTALVTGASSGIGRAMALWFAKEGVTVYAAARREAELVALKAEAGDTLIPFPLDVGDADAAHARIAKIDVDCGGLDLVVANAGVGDQTYGKRIDWNRLHQIIKVNVAGASATLVAALPGMVSRGRGHLVGVASLAAFFSLPRMAGYNASKAYLSSFCESLRFDVEKLGVHVTTVYPGFVKSEMTAPNKFKMPFLLETGDAAERICKAIVKKTPRFAFPWQMSTALGAIGLLPGPLYRAAAKRVL